MTYAEKLKDPRWQKKRLEILQRDNFTCFYCEDDKSTLHVHHEMYFKNQEPWDTPSECLTTVCEDCHTFFHIKFSKLEKWLIGCLINREPKKDFPAWKKVYRSILNNEI